MRIALIVSSAAPETSAMRSCAARDSCRTRRPITTIGTTTSGTTTRISPVSLRVGDRQEREAAHDQQHVAQRLGDAGADHGLDDAGVGGQAREHLAGARDLEEARREMQDVAVDVAAQVGHDPLAEPGHQIGAQEGRDREHDDHDADGLDAHGSARRDGPG